MKCIAKWPAGLLLLCGLANATGDRRAAADAAVPDGMVAVAGGPFIMGGGDEADEQPRHRVILSAFFLDRDEVTRAQYAACVRAGACRAPAIVGTDDARSSLPVTGVSWDDARRFCAYAQKRLPSEAEWERAARDRDGRVYPWGNQPECSRANFGNYDGEGRCPHNPGHPVAVGSFAPNDAIRDLAGNVWEWVADWYAPDYFRHAPAHNPKGPERGTRRLIKGGACCSMFLLPRASNRLAFPPDYRDDDLGFRCAR
jgi:formylglycine-generating enzyme required for sulfatase activity